MKGISFYGEEFFTIKKDASLYAEAIKRLLMTNPGERLGQPYFGVGLKNMVFELADEQQVDVVKNRIYEQVELYLPMLTILNLDTRIEDNSLFLDIKFIEKGDLPEDARLLTLEFDGVVES